MNGNYFRELVFPELDSRDDFIAQIVERAFLKVHVHSEMRELVPHIGQAWADCRADP